MRSQIVLAKLIITKKYYVTIRSYAEVNTNMTMNDKWKSSQRLLKWSWLLREP